MPRGDAGGSGGRCARPCSRHSDWHRLLGLQRWHPVDVLQPNDWIHENSPLALLKPEMRCQGQSDSDSRQQWEDRSVNVYRNKKWLRQTCLNCKKRFDAQRSTAKFCSDKCRVSKSRKESKRKHHQKGYSGKFEWYTPESIIELARETMGSIDLDPASCEAANRTVEAANG